MRPWEAKARDDARAILQAGLTAVLPQVLFREVLFYDGDQLAFPGGSVPLRDYAHVRVAAIGKAAHGMAAQAAMWGPFTEGVLVAPHAADVPGFESHPGGHPVPTKGSVAAGERVLRMAEATGPDDLLLILLSGGGSALLEVPAVPLEDLVHVTAALQRSGATVQELNCVRKHLSRVKGGQLARAAQRGTVLTLILSDVVGDDPAVIASGPTAPDETTHQDALDILEEHGLLEAAPRTVTEHFQAGAAGMVPDTPKPGDPAFDRTRNVVIGTNARALEAASRAARALGYTPYLWGHPLTGEARQAGGILSRLARQARAGHFGVKPPIAILAGGETTVTVIGEGKGGRNQEVALAAVEPLSGERAVLAAFGTDGVDGPTDAAGAIVDGLTLARARAAGVDPRVALLENDAYPFFQALNDLIQTGPTGTNVMDIALVLVGEPPA